jgi:hypothetical protein
VWSIRANMKVGYYPAGELRDEARRACARPPADSMRLCFEMPRNTTFGGGDVTRSAICRAVCGEGDCTGRLRNLQ